MARQTMTAALAVCLVLACGPGAAARPAPDDAAINRPILTDQIIPGYRALATAATALDAAARAFCADPSPARLASARVAPGTARPVVAGARRTLGQPPDRNHAAVSIWPGHLAKGGDREPPRRNHIALSLHRLAAVNSLE